MEDYMKLGIKIAMVMFIVFLFAAGCEIPVNTQLKSGDDFLHGINSRSYESGMHDGYYYLVWTNDEGEVDYQNGPDGNYFVQWNDNGSSDFNFISGKGICGQCHKNDQNLKQQT